jgi:dihydropteroate synthase
MPVGQTLIAGILNATPDSFANAGVAASVEDGLRMIAEGADILDIGGESTRPGASGVDPELEQARVVPLIRALAGRGAVISVDTRNATTMRAALDAGAEIVNDVSALRHDPAAAGVVAERRCQVVLMHMRGTPQTMQSLAHYDDVVSEVRAELRERIAAAEAAGIARERIFIDPGIGFAKTGEQNEVLLRRLAELAALGLKLWVGSSRKAFIGALSGEPDASRRMPGSVAAAVFAAQQGAACLRVHDVRETVQALRVWQALCESRR